MLAHHHLRQQFTGNIEKTVKRRIDHRMPVLVGHHEHHVIATDASIIHQIGDIVIGMGILPCVERSLYFCSLTHVKAHQFSLVSQCLHLSLHLVGCLLVRLEINDDGNPRRCQCLADGFSQASGTACYKCIFHFQLIIPVVDDRTQSTDTPVFERVAKGVASVDH